MRTFVIEVQPQSGAVTLSISVEPMQITLEA